MRRTTVAVAALVFAASMTAIDANAQAITCTSIPTGATQTADDLLTQLNLRYRTDCLGERFDADAFTDLVDRKIGGKIAGGDTLAATKRASLAIGNRSDSAASSVERKAIALAILDSIAAMTTRAASDSRYRGGHAAISELGNFVSVARGAIATNSTLVPEPLLQNRLWEWDPGRNRFAFISVDVEHAIRTACASPAAAECATAVASAELILRNAKLVERTLVVTFKVPLLKIALQKATERDNRWTSYFDETLVQFPWELAINSAIFGRHARKQMGFAGAPNSQYVFIHPMVGVEYTGAAPKGNRMTPAVAIEMIGWNGWWWGKDDKPRNAIGFSAVGSFSDHVNSSAAGYGLLVRFRSKYALTINRHGNATGVLLSSELSSWVKSKQDQAKSLMRNKGNGALK